MRIYRKYVKASLDNFNKMIISVRSGVNSDGFSIIIKDSEGHEVFDKRYDYGYNASYSKNFADKNEPYVSDIIDELCSKYNISKKDIKVISGKNVFKNSKVDNSDVDRFISKYIKSCNITSSTNIDFDKLYEIADRYTTSYPLSGDWSIEVLHEQKAISKELGVSMNKAKQLMIDELGFTKDMFNTKVNASV